MATAMTTEDSAAVLNGFGKSNGVKSLSSASNSCSKSMRSLLSLATVEDGVDFLSDLQLVRVGFVPPRPAVLQGNFRVAEEWHSKKYDGSGRVQKSFPKLWGRPALRLVKQAGDNQPQPEKRTLNIGIVLSGGQAPGGHNVIIGVMDFLNERCPGSRLYGFLGGCKGIINNKYRELHNFDLMPFRNQGGFHLIGSGRDKIEKPQQLEAAANTAQALQLDGLVIIGGDDSNTNAAVLAEYFLENNISTCVVGVPKTIDGDLKNLHVPVSFGFDTACKVYSEMIGNIMIDAASAGKYYHFVRLMGRSASHITLECALQTHPQLALVSEEVDWQKQTLKDITAQIADMICKRSEAGKNYGVVLLPEGLIESVAEIHPVIDEINDLLAADPDLDHITILPQLTDKSRAVFECLPITIRMQLMLDRDPHGNVQVARVETEKLLIKLVDAELKERKDKKMYSGKFSGLPHYFGYEGRCSLPTNFDATYCYSLGYGAGALIQVGATGLMVTLNGLEDTADSWRVGGVPLVNMMDIERRKGEDKPVIKKALVQPDSPAYTVYQQLRDQWALRDCFRAPGPIQFADDSKLSNQANFTLSFEINDGEPVYI